MPYEIFSVRIMAGDVIYITVQDKRFDEMLLLVLFLTWRFLYIDNQIHFLVIDSVVAVWYNVNVKKLYKSRKEEIIWKRKLR